jgi:hypothetical protein
VVLTGLLCAALCTFLASFDGLLMSKFLADVHAQTLPVRIWNSLNLQVEPTIAEVSGLVIGGDDSHSWHRRSTAARTGTTPWRGEGSNLKPFATKRWRGAWLIRAQPVSLMIAVSPSDMSLSSGIMCGSITVFSACTPFRRHTPRGQL